MMQSLPFFATARKVCRFFYCFIFLHLAVFLAANDTIPPNIVCPPAITALLPVGNCDTIINYFNTIALDDSPVTVTQTGGLPSGSAFPIGTTVNTFLATDTAGNTASCSFQINLHNQLSISCPNLVKIYLDYNCEASVIIDSLLDPPLSMACHDSMFVTAKYTNNPTEPLRPFGQAETGRNILYIVWDKISGNNCYGNIRVYDTLPPYPVCADIVLPLNVPPAVVTPAYLVNTLEINEGQIIFTDNCGGPDTTYYTDQMNVFSCSNPDNYTRAINRTWHVKDINGNAGSCLQHIYFQRDTNDVRFPADTTFSCTYTGETTTAQTGYPYTEVNGIRYSLFPQVPSGLFIQFEDSLQAFQCAGSRIIKRFWSVTDVCNNNAPFDPHKLHTQHIYILDDTKPVITAPASLVFSANSGTCTDSVAFPVLLIEDSCSPLESVTASWMDTDSTIRTVAGLLVNPANPGTAVFDTSGVFAVIPDFPTGVTQVLWTATDVCGNSGTALTTIDLYDGHAPVAVCKPAVTVVLDNTGHWSLPADALLASWTDGCADTVVVRARRLNSTGVFAENLLFDCSDGADSILFSVRVYDINVASSVAETFGAGQYATCTSTVAVMDTSVFQCSSPANVVITCENYNPDLSVYGAFTFSCVTDSVYYTTDNNLFEPSCNIGTIQRVVTAWHANQSITCHQQITVHPGLNDYFIRFPRDTNLTVCSGNLDFGTPELIGTTCQVPTITYTDDIFFVVPDACYKIERTWSVRNQCSGNVALTFIPNPNGLEETVVSDSLATAPWAPTIGTYLPNQPPVNYSTFWTPSGAGYQYKQLIKYAVTADPEIFCPTEEQLVCDSTANDPLFWNLPALLGGEIAGDKKEAPAEIRCYFKESCQKPASFNYPGGFELYLDLDGDDYGETVVYAPGNQKPGEVVYGNNSSVIADSSILFDNRVLPLSEKYKFGWEVVDLDTIAYFRLVWTTDANPGLKIIPQLPEGRHSIKWRVYDFCGNSSTCTYSFEVKQCCLSPNIWCRQDTVPYLLENNWALVPAGELLVDIEDQGCQVVLRVATEPITAGPLQPGLLVNCTQEGILPVFIFAENEDGQVATCPAYIEVIDTSAICDPVETALGQILTYTSNAGVDNVSVRFLSATAQTASVPTNTAGLFSWASTDLYTGGYEVRPYKNDDATNGLTAFDLIKISRHILNFEPLEFPYQVIAADANRSGTVTTFDIVELRKLLLGTYDTLPLCNSWLFIPPSHVFNYVTQNPFSPSFPEALAVAPGTTYAFVGVKVGDLDYSVIPNLVSGETEDRHVEPRFLNTTDQWLDAGQSITIALAPEPGVAAVQGTLSITGAQITGILPSPTQTAEDFALHNTQTLAFVAFDQPQPFRVAIQAEKPGFLSEMVQLTGDITPSLAFDAAGNSQPLAIGFDHRLSAAPATSLQVLASPNPLQHNTTLQFTLQQEGNTTIEVTDAQGKRVWFNTSHYPAGTQQVRLDARDWSSGVYVARVISNSGMAQVKLVVE